MGGGITEIEHRFFVPDSTIVPPSTKRLKITQCYLPRWKLKIVDGAVWFKGDVEDSVKDRMLVSADKVSREEVEEINRLLGMDPIQVESFRIRIQDEDACVTVKGPGNLKRFEAEWPVLKADVEKMVVSRQYKSVTKTRHIVPFKDGLYWEIDFFEGDNKGLVMAELEVPSIDYQFDRPDWLGKEVTEENKLGNGSLAKQAWCDLQEDDEELMRWLMGPN